MECGDWKERISASIDGEIPAGEVRSIREHLEQCSPCRTLERRMRAVTVCLARTETDVPPHLREKLFARMEAEGLLPKRRSLFAYSLRWAAIPLAAAAALFLFLLSPGDRAGNRLARTERAPQVALRTPASGSPAPAPLAAAGRSLELTPEEREIVAHLEILEDPSAFEDPEEIDEMEISEPAAGGKG